MKVDQQPVLRAMRWVWAVRWTRNRLGDAAMLVVVFWLYSLIGIGEEVPIVVAFMLAFMELFSREVIELCLERVERLAPQHPRERYLLSLTRLLRREVKHQSRATWTLNLIHPIRIIVAVALGIMAVNNLPGVTGTIIFLTLAAYCFLALNLAAARGLAGRWRYSSAVHRFNRRFGSTEQ